ncbi:MAG TPA: site-specific integrase [Candidatus Solibacter sp.]|nr:site-specific integrase [Candidatus Solibacter sp.]
MSKRPRGTGAIFNVPGSRFLWVGYTDAKGEYVRESSKETQPTSAQKFLNNRLQAVANGNFLGPRVERITVHELFDDLLQDYRTHGQFALWPERCWNAHLLDYFGGETLKADKRAEKYSGMKAARVGTAQIAGYVEQRTTEGAAKSTINRELALLRRAFSLGFDAEPQKVSRIPKFHRFIVSEKGNERRGFVEEEQYRKLAELVKEPWLRAMLALAYTYGFRKAELLEMKCSQVDLLSNTVSLYSGETKNGEPRTVYLTEECRLLVTELRKSKQPEDFLLTRKNGESIHDLRGTWAALTEEAKLPGLLLHDFRRSAVRNMIRRGVPQKTAREISGHKTDSVFNRYNIVSEADLQEAARKIEAGAKAVIHSSFTVEPEGPSNERRQQEEKPIQSVS